jgi:hypothetical protein
MAWLNITALQSQDRGGVLVDVPCWTILVSLPAGGPRP